MKIPQADYYFGMESEDTMKKYIKEFKRKIKNARLNSCIMVQWLVEKGMTRRSKVVMKCIYVDMRRIMINMSLLTHIVKYC